MIRLFFSLLLLLHGCLHLAGFALESHLFKWENLIAKPAIYLSSSTEKSMALMWLAVAVLFITTAVFLFTKKNNWWQAAFISILFSQSLIFIYWPAAKAGTLVNILLLGAATLAFSKHHFKLMVRNETKDLFKLEKWHKRKIITHEMISGLPYPVYNWLSHCGIMGKEDIYCVRLKQAGTMRLKPNSGKWIPAYAEQYFTLNNPAFTWIGQIKLTSFLTIWGRDKLVNGEGNMLIKAASLMPIANESGPKINESTLQRFLAEICWFPSAALHKNIHWDAIDSKHAKATIQSNDTTASVVFTFNDKGEITECSADRYNGNKPVSVKEKWVVSINKTGIKDGISIPLEVEVTWKFKAGDFTWYKLSITDIAYNFPYIY